MKNIARITTLLIALQLISCKEDGNEKSKQDLKTDMLTEAAWSHATVTHEDGDLSDQYTDFAILFTAHASDGFDGNYIISNGGYAFSETAGKWRFNDTLDKIILDSEKEMDIELEEGHLQLDFTVPAPGGKAAGLSGHFIFELQPM